ncbi:MAG: thioredoxin domain-containing protein [Patescibacteria group bacterium]
MDTNNNNNKANYVLSGSILIAAILIAGSVIYSKGLGVADKTANVGDAAENDNVPVVSADNFVVEENDIVFGEANAPVAIFLYSDPSCPFCGAADGGNKEVMDYLKSNSPTWTPPIPGIIENYVNTGKARLIYRYFPGHGTGEEAMKILYCANEQGKFWELHRAISENQSVVADAAKVKGLATGVGADISKINSCLDAKKYDSKIQSDTSIGTKSGVNGTPAFFVNGTLVSGAQPFSAFKTVIDPLLK